jgi:hypothetical protein
MDAARSTDMLTEYEVQKLERGMKQDWNAASGVIPTCAALLLMIVVLSLIGSWNDPHRDMGGGVAASQYSASSQPRGHIPAAGGGMNAEGKGERPQAQPLAHAERVAQPTDERIDLPTR